MSVVNVSTVPANVTIVNNGKVSRAIKIARYSQNFELTAGNTVILRADTSSELLGYLAQAKDDVAVTFAAIVKP